MNLRSLRVFVGLMEEGTLTRAAERMHLSQSAASRLLALLEAELGAALFLRERRRMVPLAAAEALYPEALRILSQTEALREVVRGDRPAPLRVLCQTRLSPGLAVPAIARFVERSARPVRLETAPRRELARRVLAGRHDVVVATLPLPVGRDDATPLGTVPLGVLLPRGHPLAGEMSLDTRQLTATPYVALDETTVIRRMLDASGARLPRPTVEVSTGSAAYRLVAAGLGFTFADRLAVEPELRDRVVLVAWDRTLEVSVGVLVTRAEDADVETFAETLRAVVSETP